MLRIPPAPTVKKPAAVKHHPLDAAAAVGALLGVGVLLLTLAGVPVLAWMLLGAVATTALVDLARTAAGRQSPSLIERLAQRQMGCKWPGGPGRLSIGVIQEAEGGGVGGGVSRAGQLPHHLHRFPLRQSWRRCRSQWQRLWPRSVKVLPGSGTNRQS